MEATNIQTWFIHIQREYPHAFHAIHRPMQGPGKDLQVLSHDANAAWMSSLKCELQIAKTAPSLRKLEFEPVIDIHVSQNGSVAPTKIPVKVEVGNFG